MPEAQVPQPAQGVVDDGASDGSSAYRYILDLDRSVRAYGFAGAAGRAEAAVDLCDRAFRLDEILGYYSSGPACS